jgi:malonate transporter and related proteins
VSGYRKEVVHEHRRTCSFPVATIVVLLAAKYKTMEAESASTLLLSTLSLVVTVPITIAVSR